jgi:hypothetical protein
MSRRVPTGCEIHQTVFKAVGLTRTGMNGDRICRRVATSRTFIGMCNTVMDRIRTWGLRAKSTMATTTLIEART